MTTITPKMCDLCKKEESEWDKSAFIFTFAFTIEGDDKEKYYCPACTLKRLMELSKKTKEDNEE